jgi:ribosome-associated toxin RatA of RatAB toxin-antitoxin module
VNQPDPEQRARVKAAILIDSPTPHVWNIMIDCEQAPDFVPGLRSCRVVRHEGSSDIIEHRVKFSWYLPTITYRFRAQYRGLQKIEFTRVEGDLRELEGSWTLKQVDDGRKTIVVYSVYVDAGFLVPQWLVRRILRGNLPDLLLAPRRRVSELSME